MIRNQTLKDGLLWGALVFILSELIGVIYEGHGTLINNGDASTFEAFLRPGLWLGFGVIFIYLYSKFFPKKQVVSK